MARIEDLKRKFDSNQFDNFITEITFPYFKNIKVGTKINIKFPLTVLIGQNGCGKSSCLQALKGCPSGVTPGEFWFSTPVDEITEKDISSRYPGIKSVLPTILYKYKSNNTEYNVLYQAAKRENDPDYWETRKPSKSYGMMNTDRHENITKNTIYLDFRSELSAFDKYFYFGERHNHKNIKANKKQDYLRTQGKRLKNVFETDVQQKVPNSKKTLYFNEKPILFTQEIITEINKILGKKYVSAKLVNHRFFEREGFSILFRTSNLNYSEAFAGSGEMAASILVYKIITAENNSLILLDEPEVSLHPKAQEKLKDFLIEQSIRKNLQVIVSTHSPFFVNNLPDEAIKVFREDINGTFEVLENISYLSAFNIVGFSFYDQKTILTEDELSTLIIQEVIRKFKNEIPAMADINVRNNYGGAEDMYKDAANILRLERSVANNHFFVLDGDKYIKNFDTIETWSVASVTKENLDKHIKEVTNVEAKNLFVKNSNPSVDDLINQRKEFIEFCNDHVVFLPSSVPESIIWSEDCCKQLLASWNITSEDILNSINVESCFKNKFLKLAEIKTETPTANDILEIQKNFIISWINSESENVQKTKEIILSCIS